MSLEDKVRAEFKDIMRKLLPDGLPDVKLTKLMIDCFVAGWCSGIIVARKDKVVDIKDLQGVLKKVVNSGWSPDLAWDWTLPDLPPASG